MKNTIPRIKELYAPIDFYGKTFIVLTLCKDDVEKFFSPKVFANLTDDDMSSIAEKLGDALMDNYWIALDCICDDYEKEKERDKKF